MDPSTLEQHGLNPATIATHQRRVKRALTERKAPQFVIHDTCRLHNNGILPLSRFQNTGDVCNIVAFIPAAGAATRYAAVFNDLRACLVDGEKSAVVAVAKALTIKGPVPPTVAALLTDPENFPSERYSAALMELQKPKALQPCVTGDDLTFLQAKDLEHAALPDLMGQMYIAPVGQTAAFTEQLTNSTVKPAVIEQGPDLCTLRFNAQGEPVWDDDQPSFVPAGHGALTEKLPAVRSAFPGSEAVFIRNIDNLMGTAPAAINATNRFLQAYSLVFKHLQSIRGALRDLQIDQAQRFAIQLLASVEIKANQTNPLTQVLQDLFYTKTNEELEELRAAFERPFNMLGQVPNTANDVGGTPCFVHRGDQMIKLCLEVPHASPSDKEAFLANPEKATHFNPVFACAEVTEDATYYADLADDFWLLAKKQHRGATVYYHESVLYELIGNSVMANCMFVEVPRIVFHPHKTIADGADRTKQTWFAKNGV